MINMLLISSVLLQGAVTPHSTSSSIVLENEALRVEVSRSNGAVTRIFDKIGSLELIREPRLSGNFMFSLPIPGKQKWETLEANYIIGVDQRLTRFDQDGHKLTLYWNGPLKSCLGTSHKVKVTMGIELLTSSVRFTLHVDNPTKYDIGETYFPIIGGLKGLGKTATDLKQTGLVLPGGASVPIFKTFANFSWLGAQGPEQFYSYPGNLTSPWVDFYQPRLGRSVYVGLHDPSLKSKVLHLELLPGSSGTTRWDGNWPRPEESKNLPVGVRLDFVEFANVPAGGAYEASPVEVKFHNGDWHEGQKLFDTWKNGSS